MSSDCEANFNCVDKLDLFQAIPTFFIVQKHSACAVYVPSQVLISQVLNNIYTADSGKEY